MMRHARRWSAGLRRGLSALAITALLLVGAPPAQAALPAWDGSINLYRTGVFTTQKTWYYCTAADVQIIRNIVRHEEDHSRASQDRYFAYMRDHMRYQVPVKHGVDPAGWTAGMRRFVDDRYRLVRSETFRSFIRSAVRSLRRTNLPVALFVDHGNHGWVLHGFTATADPAVTSDFKVTSVRVTGPLWGRQNATYGYDMKPNKKLTRAQLRDFVTRWHYAPIRMVYEGEFLSIQPIGAAATATTTESAAATHPAGLEATAGSTQVAATADPAVELSAATPALEPTSGSVAQPTAGGTEVPTQSPVAIAATVAGAGPPGGPEPSDSMDAFLILTTGTGLALLLLVWRRSSVRLT